MPEESILNKNKNRELNPMNKKALSYLIFAAIVFLVLLAVIYFFSQRQKEKEPLPAEKTLEETLQDLTAPSGEIPEVPAEVIEALTSPESEQQVSEETFQDLTAPE